MKLGPFESGRVYVGDARHRFGRMVMCHMVADSLAELHLMAVAVGLKRAWFQDHDPDRPHYDVGLEKRRLAVKRGARPISQREAVGVLKRWREGGRR